MEIWKEIKGFKNYEVSSLGRIKSLASIVIYSNGKIGGKKEKFLKLNLNGSGYLGMSLSKNNKRKTKTIHQLMAIAFLNHKPSGCKLVVDHINNVKTDNRLENLQLITHRENVSKDRKGSSKHTGVSWNKRRSKWKSSIQINGKPKHLGYFTDELEAAQAYQNALKKLL